MIISLSSVFVVRKAQEFVPFRILASIYKPFFSTIAMGIVMFFVKQIYFHTFQGVILTSLSGAVTYLFVLFFVFKVNIIKEATSLVGK